MGRGEFETWIDFFVAHPFDDRHRYHRPAALIASGQRTGVDVQDMLDWLAPTPIPEGMSDADMRTMKAFGILPEKG